MQGQSTDLAYTIIKCDLDLPFWSLDLMGSDSFILIIRFKMVYPLLFPYSKRRFLTKDFREIEVCEWFCHLHDLSLKLFRISWPETI